MYNGKIIRIIEAITSRDNFRIHLIDPHSERISSIFFIDLSNTTYNVFIKICAMKYRTRCGKSDKTIMSEDLQIRNTLLRMPIRFKRFCQTEKSNSIFGKVLKICFPVFLYFNLFYFRINLSNFNMQ